jgi:hypothetical protein
VLAGKLGKQDLSPETIVGFGGPELKKHPIPIPTFHAADASLASWLKAVPDRTLTFRTTGQNQDVTFVPFDRLFDERYSIYWTVA